MRPTQFNVEFNSALNGIGRISCREKFNQGTMVQRFDIWAAIVAPIKKKREAINNMNLLQNVIFLFHRMTTH